MKLTGTASRFHAITSTRPKKYSNDDDDNDDSNDDDDNDDSNDDDDNDDSNDDDDDNKDIT